MLDVSSLKKAIRQCDEILKQLELHPEDDIIQDAAIQRFEYTYSLTISLLIRFLGECLPTNETVKQMSFQEVIRTANQIGILQKDLKLWLIFREKRNITFHIYNGKKATEVESSTLKCNLGSKRLKKEKRDVKMAFSGIKKYENVIQAHLRKRS